MINIKEFVKQITVLEVSFRNFNISDNEVALEIWYENLKDLNVDEFKIAVGQIVATKKFAPTIAEIREIATNLEEKRDWSEGWKLVTRAIQNFGLYRELEALEYVKERDERAYKVLSNLSFKELCMSENIMTDRANFRMAYENTTVIERERNAIPQKIKDGINELIQIKKMPQLPNQEAIDRDYLVLKDEIREEEEFKKLYGDIEISDDEQFPGVEDDYIPDEFLN